MLIRVAQKSSKASKRPSPQTIQIIPPPNQPTYEPIDLAKVPPPVKPIIDRDYVAAENLDLQSVPDAIIKDRLGVSAYPTVDLTKDLPGVPPTDDFSKHKAQNQTGHDAFLKSIEPYFRPFNEEDLTFLRQQVFYTAGRSGNLRVTTSHRISYRLWDRITWKSGRMTVKCHFRGPPLRVLIPISRIACHGARPTDFETIN